MPIYEYGCPDCGHDFEALQKLSDPPISTCPSCGATRVEKKISRTSFVLKGGGWYKDHYGLKSGGGSKSESGGDGGASKGGSDTSSAPAPASSSPAGGPSSSTSGTGSSGSAA